MERKIWWPWAIKNIAIMICWTVLAIAFDKWWIALFSLLCMDIVKSTPTRFYYRICDKCGKHGPLAETEQAAIQKAEDSGWIVRKIEDKWDDRCPECLNK